MINVREYFGEIDIYLFDQILKNQFDDKTVILDAGCGGGRNIVYFLRLGCEVYGVDRSSEAVHHVRSLGKLLAPNLPAENFQTAEIERLPFSDAKFDLVISSAVLHFAADENHFEQMMREMWRVLKPGGMLFARLASDIGIENRVASLDNRWHHLPDGSERFLVDQEMLLQMTAALGATLAEPIKTTNVQNLRAMTTWIIRKM